MASTDRIFYAVQAVGIAPATGDGTNAIAAIPATGAGGKLADAAGFVATSKGFEWIHGLQTAGITTTFNTENLFEYGQLQVYQYVEDLPTIEITLEKVLDGHKCLYLQSVGQAGTGNVFTAAKSTCSAYMVIYPDNFSSASGTGANSFLYCSGMYVGNVNYTFGVDGNFTESITLQGYDKKWFTPDTTSSFVTPFKTAATFDSPLVTGIARRNSIVLENSSFPTEVANNIRSGSGNVQNISISCDFGREDNFELGKYRPYTKFTSIPLQTTCDFEVVSLSGDIVNASGDNVVRVDAPATNSIKIQLDINGTGSTAPSGLFEVDLGSAVRLKSVNYTGGDTGGGNASVTYSYVAFNTFSVKDSHSSVTGYWKQ
jgi:hypothetical protein